MLGSIPPLRYLNEEFIVDGTVVGGDLAGTLPNPTLEVIGPPMGPTGDDETVGAVTIDAKGRVTGLTAVSILFPPNANGVVVGGDLEGTLPNPTLDVIGVATGPVGNATTVAAVGFDTKGRITSTSSIPVSFPAPGGVKAYYYCSATANNNIGGGNGAITFGYIIQNIGSGFTQIGALIGYLQVDVSGYVQALVHVYDSETSTGPVVQIVKNLDNVNPIARTIAPLQTPNGEGSRLFQLYYTFPVVAGDSIYAGVNASGSTFNIIGGSGNGGTGWYTWASFTLF